ncbi:chloride channel protein [Coprococcus eutactus]|jgi:H+/Cl- antiporter ClcA|uniref:chloride channel protein n=1 Tax=Coprococcus ammoniilyticus TaxID=2981785 RepID=UPI0008219708|nr:chloride channel protein [Coprococcus ammoniilyticus]MCU6730960.1 chloride channel protein [Coprococcus ammoniilyticus]NSE51769.1 chloride channel protein [Coprococcus eutactus]SCH87444.1 H(+)/Cl(-) exchange transporter ClcA [uncultured Coprococcus sp.]
MIFTKEYWLNCIDRTKRYAKTFIKWLICSAIIGITCGAVGTAFHYSVEYVTQFRSGHSWIIFLLPAAGLLIVFLYRAGGIKHDKGTNLVIGSIRNPEYNVPFRMAPLIFITTVITHLFGGSAGREGAALQIGGSLGASIGKLIKMDDNDKHIMTLCGMSAVFAALFGTPVTAALFSVEVISIGILYYSALVPCILSATISYAITEKFHITPTYFILNQVPEMSLATGIRVIILSVAAAVLSILFCMSMQVIGKTFKKYLKNQYLRILVGGVLLVLLTLAVRCNDYNGAGMNIIEQAIHGTAKPEAFILKLLFTCITIGCGFRGGEIVPSFFIGATFGCTLGGWIGLDPGFGAAMGLVCLFCGVVNCPLASLVLSIELFGASGILLFAIGCSVSYMLSGYYSLYSEQKIIYSKLRPHYVNLYTNQEVKTNDHSEAE